MCADGPPLEFCTEYSVGYCVGIEWCRLRLCIPKDGPAFLSTFCHYISDTVLSSVLSTHLSVLSTYRVDHFPCHQCTYATSADWPYVVARLIMPIVTAARSAVRSLPARYQRGSLGGQARAACAASAGAGRKLQKKLPWYCTAASGLCSSALGP